MSFCKRGELIDLCSILQLPDWVGSHLPGRLLIHSRNGPLLPLKIDLLKKKNIFWSGNIPGKREWKMGTGLLLGEGRITVS